MTEIQFGPTMPVPERFDTPRLTAERLRAAHVEDMCALHRDARVMATLNGVRTDEQTAEMVAKGLRHWDAHGFGFWMFRDRTDGQFVGRAHLGRVHIARNDEVEVGYALRAAYWGRGLATEMTRALLPIGFARLGLDSLVSFTLPTNRASQRVMEKCGFQYERGTTWADLPHVLYRLHRERFEET